MIITIIVMIIIITERSLEVELPTIWTNEKQRWEESEKRKKKEDQKRESLRMSFRVAGTRDCAPCQK